MFNYSTGTDGPASNTVPSRHCADLSLTTPVESGSRNVRDDSSISCTQRPY